MNATHGIARRASTTVVVIVALAAGMTPARATEGSGVPTNLRLRAALELYVAEHPSVPGAVLHVEAPALGLSWEGASGLFAFDEDRPQASTDPFRTASVTKTFTAAAMLRLVEEDELSLGDSIADHLPTGLVQRIAVIDHRSYGRRITIRQLLNHTSGVYDYATDPGWRTDVLADPQRLWRPRELVHVAIRSGAPYFRPGRGFHYSDTGYVLLGLIIEHVTRLPLAEAYRELLPIAELGLDHTYLEGREPTPADTGDRAHQYIDEIDTTSWNPSFDNFGGGGLVSTAGDLDSFIRALFEGRVFSESSTLRSMLRVSRHADVALGLFGDRVVGRRAWNHTGFFGSFVYYVPSLDLSFAGSMNQATASNLGLIRSVIRIVEDAGATR
jgi:D-alanyl-D-alanine carboxypeptidase